MPIEPGTVDFFNSHGPDELHRATIMDPQLRLQRNRLLWKMVDDGGKRIREKYMSWHDRIRPLAWTDVLTVPINGDRMDVLKSDFDHNVQRVYKVLSHSAANLTYRLQATNLASIDVAALNFCGMELNDLQISLPKILDGAYRLYEDANRNGKVDDGDPLVAETTAVDGSIRFSLARQILPTPKYRGEEIDGTYWEFFDTLSGRAHFLLTGTLAPEKRHPLEWTQPEITASATNPVTGAIVSSGWINSPDAIPSQSIGIVAYDASQFFDLDAPQRSLAEFLSAHPQFVASTDRPGAAELHGTVTIPATVIVPHSVPLIVRPGADITMAPGASMVCFGGFKAEGTATEPIRVHGNPSGDPWGVLGIVRPKEKVVMRHAHFSGADQAQINGILFTGGVAVYESDLDVESCQFVKMNSEDGLNLKNGRIAMRDCLFSGNAADSCDLDFVTGTVTQSRFVKSGNDGLDISGAQVVVTRCRFEHNGDKGTSVGENSHPIIVDCLYVGNQIGTSCKDKSLARIAHCSYIDNRLGLEAIRKKPFFGGGAGEFVNCVFSQNDVLRSEDYFSQGQLQITHSMLDESIASPTCLTAKIDFQNPGAADYRFSPPAETGTTVSLGSPEWLDDSPIPENVSRPGIFSELPMIGEAVFPSDSLPAESAQ
jgi:hypothetical protein